MYSLWKVYSLSFMVKLDRYSLLIRVYLLHWREKLYHLITAKDDISTRKINDTKWTSDCSTTSIQPVTSYVILKRFSFKTFHLVFSSVRSFYVRQYLMCNTILVFILRIIQASKKKKKTMQCMWSRVQQCALPVRCVHYCLYCPTPTL